MKRMIILAIMLMLSAPAFAQAPPPPPPATPMEEELVLPPDFRPLILETELQRAVTVGNPPHKPRWYSPLLPNWFRRPVEIPKSYPLREQDGERFLP